MTVTGVAALGLIAGATIFLGLPLGRARTSRTGLRVGLNAAAIGILVFLLWDILTGAIEPVESALETATEPGGGWGRFIGLALLLVAGLALGLVGLAGFETWMRRPGPSLGPGAASIAEYRRGRSWLSRTPAQRVALLIATGIGLHNFAEGLAIGQSAAAGQMALAVLLVVGFALHNATEGFGIVGPLGADDDRPSWGLLVIYGLIGGGPTFIGTLVGQAVVSAALTVVFLGLAAGSILYVVVQLAGTAVRAARPLLVTTALLGGFVLGLGTDFFLDAVGG